MSDLIDREQAVKIIDEIDTFCAGWRDYAISRIKSLPSARQTASGCEYWDSESNFCSLHRPSAEKTGKWIWTDGVRCSRCNHKLQTTGLPTYCPNCKVKMEEE